MACVLGLEEIDRTLVAVTGGKGAHLGELTRIDGVSVPAGFCVTTEAFGRVAAAARALDDRLDRLSRLDSVDLGAIRELSAEIRRAIEQVGVPADVRTEIMSALRRLGTDVACAVRSSATAEDLPDASFAGQHDTFLNIVGADATLHHVSRCWASLFTERAVTYRMAHGVDHRRVRMAVVVQRMVFPDAAGVLFTADPVTSNRRVTSVEACLGLGEALVAGAVTPDVYQVRDGEIVARTIAAKRVAMLASPMGGTHREAVAPDRQEQPALTDAQVARLAQLGRRLEAHFRCPQDIEWCVAGDTVHILQSRPITTLFPIPDAGDAEPHVYVSVGHGQMMTDPMRPLGLSVWQLTAARRMYDAGGRLFVDVADALASPATWSARLELLRRSDPLTGDALQTLLERTDVIGPTADEPPAPPEVPAPASAIATDPAIVTELIARTQASIAALKRDIRTVSGPALLDLILADIQELRRILFDPLSHQALMAGMEAAWWLNERLQAWLGERNAADILSQSVAHNVTSEMGLALLRVADVIRPHAEVVRHLERVDGDDFRDGLPALPGGREVRDAIDAYLDAYGMRCAGEIDITRPRWSERPSTLAPVILANIRTFEPGEAERRFERGRHAAMRKEQEVLERLRSLPDGEARATETRAMIARLRTFTGYREYPKYGMVSRYLVYKQALLAEAERLVGRGVLRDREDIFYLRFDEIRDVVRTGRVDEQLVRTRREAFRSYHALMAPRVMTSDGEVVVGAYRRDDVPAGALAGLGVSGGTVEGRARVVTAMAEADLEAGDILVTSATDPSWSPLFLSIGGLVAEVGGYMSHGTVVAREYGLPAVVGVENATRLIRDGQRIRVHGGEGYVVVLD